MRRRNEAGAKNWRNRRVISPEEFSLSLYGELRSLALAAGEVNTPLVRDTLDLILGFAHKPEVFMARIPDVRLRLLTRLQERQEEGRNDFLPLPPRDVISGEVFVGRIIRSPRDRNPLGPFFLSLKEILQGVGYLGAQGCGKSTSVLYLASQVMRLGYPVWFIEIKSEANVLLHLHPDILVFDIPKTFKYDPLKPLPGVDERLWLQTLTDVVHQATPMKPETSETFFHECYQLRQHDPSASFIDLPSWLDKRIDESPSAEKGKFRTVRGIVVGIVEKLGPMLDCKEGYSWEILVQKSCIFRLKGLRHNMQRLAANLIQLPLTFLRARASERDTLRQVLCFDEAKMMFGKENFGRGTTTGVPFIKELWTQMRGLGVGNIFADNVSIDLAQFPKLNASVLFYFRQGTPDGIREALQATGAQERHKPHFYGLRKERQAFAKKTGHPFPILVEMASFPKGRHIGDEELEMRMAPKLAALTYRPHNTGLVPTIHVADNSSEQSDERAKRGSSPDTPSAGLPDEWASFLIHVVEHPDQKVSDLYGSYGLSHRKAHRLRRELEENGLIATRTQNTGTRGRPSIYLRVTEKGVRFLNGQREGQ